MCARRRDPGFTATELLVVLVIVSIVAAVAVAAVRRAPRDAQTWADTIGRTLAAARLRAITSRQWYRVTIEDTQVTTELSPAGAPPASCTDAAATWTRDPALSPAAPRDALVWKAAAAAGAPAVPRPVDLKVCFRPDFTHVVRVGSDTTSYLNAYVYVSSPVRVSGWQYRVALEGAGVVHVTNPW